MTDAPTYAIDRRHFIAGATALTLAGCQTDKTQLITSTVQMVQGITISEADEIRLGTTGYGPLIDQSGGPYRNRSVQQAVQRIADPMFHSAKRANMPWEITVLDDPTINAWALPGGKLGINRGLLRYCADEDEVAAAIAHEIGHVEHAHAVETMRRSAFLNGLGDIGQSLIRSNTGGAGGALADQAITALRGPMFQLVTTGYGRDYEYEADGNILIVFNRLGYEPRRSSELFQVLLRIVPPSNNATTSLFSTHPGTIDRIAKLDAAATTLPTAPARAASPDFETVKRSFPTPAGFGNNSPA